MFWSAGQEGDRARDQTEAAVWARRSLSERALVSFGVLMQERDPERVGEVRGQVAAGCGENSGLPHLTPNDEILSRIPRDARQRE